MIFDLFKNIFVGLYFGKEGIRGIGKKKKDVIELNEIV